MSKKQNGNSADLGDGMKISKIFASIFVTAFLFACAATEVKIPEQRKISNTNFEASLAPPVETEPVEVKKAESPLKPIGDFMNIKTDGEHQWGYSIELWRQDDKIYGAISGDNDLRLMGDPPRGILEDVRLNTATKNMSFRASLWSHKTVEFEGILTKKKLEGKIIITIQDCSKYCSEKKKMTFPRSKEWSSYLEEYKTFAEWKADHNYNDD